MDCVCCEVAADRGGSFEREALSRWQHWLSCARMKTSPGDACRSNAMRRRVYCATVSIHGIKHDSDSARKPIQLPGEERRVSSLWMDEEMKV